MDIHPGGPYISYIKKYINNLTDGDTYTFSTLIRANRRINITRQPYPNIECRTSNLISVSNNSYIDTEWQLAYVTFVYNSSTSHSGFTFYNYQENLQSGDYIDMCCIQLTEGTLQDFKLSSYGLRYDINADYMEAGNIDISSGNNTDSTVRIRLKDYIKVKPNCAYLLERMNVSNGAIGCRWYDSSYTYISSSAYTGTYALTTSPSNAKYFRFIDESNNLNNTYRFSLLENNVMPSVAYPSEIYSVGDNLFDNYITDGLKLHYDGIYNVGNKLHSNNPLVWKDLSGNNFDGTLLNTTVSSKGFTFDGTSMITNNVEQTYTNITLEVVLKGATTSTYADILSLDSTAGTGIVLYGVTYGYKFWWIKGTQLTTPDAVSCTETTHLAVSLDNNGNCRFYKNGILVHNLTDVTTGVTGFLSMGTLRGLPNRANRFKGEIYSVRIYDRILEDEEIKNNYDTDVKRFIQNSNYKIGLEVVNDNTLPTVKQIYLTEPLHMVEVSSTERHNLTQGDRYYLTDYINLNTQNTDWVNYYNYNDTNNVSNNSATSSTVDDEGWITLSINNTSSSTLYCNYWLNPIPDLIVNTDYTLVVEVKEVSGYNATLTLTGAHTSYPEQVQFISPPGVKFRDLVPNSCFSVPLTTISSFESSIISFRTFVAIGPSESCTITFRMSLFADANFPIDNFVYIPYNGFTGFQSEPTPGIIEVQRNIKEGIIDGTQDIKVVNLQQGYNEYGFSVGNNILRNDNNSFAPAIYSDKFSSTSRNELFGSTTVPSKPGITYGITGGVYYKDIVVFSEELKNMSLEEVKTTLNSNPIKVIYQLETTETEKLGINNVKTLPNSCEVNINSEISPINTELRYKQMDT